MKFTTRPLAVASALGLVAAAPLPAQAATTSQVKSAVEGGVGWITAQQVPATGVIDPQDGLSTDFVFSAVAAAGRHPADTFTGAGNPTLQDAAVARYGASAFAAAVDPVTRENPAGYGADNFVRALLAAPAAGIDPLRVTADQNLLAQLVATYRPATGTFGDGSQAIFATIALARAGAPGPLVDRTVDHLLTQQLDDGGWNFYPVSTPADRTGSGDADTTASAVAALCEAGFAPSSTPVRRGLEHLHGRLLPSGGIDTGYAPSFPANSDTQSWVISALSTCGIDPQSARWTSKSGNSLVDFLLTKQVPLGQPDAGAFTTPGWPIGAPDAVSFYSTQDATRALAGEGFSAEPPARLSGSAARKRTITTPAAGTVTPHALVVDAGDGDVRACRVAAPVDAAISAFLALAPAACVAGTGSGGWTVQLDQDPAAALGTQTVPFGDTVLLRRVIAAGPGPQGEAGAKGDAGAKGEAGAKGDAGADGAPGVSGPQGAAGPQGIAGAKGATGAAGADAKVTCTVRTVRGKASSVRCTVSKAKAASKARLTRGGRTYARGTLGELRVVRALRPGRYALRIGGGAKVALVTVRR